MAEKPLDDVPPLPHAYKPAERLAVGDCVLIGNTACPVAEVYRVRIEPLAHSDLPARVTLPSDRVVISYRLQPGGEVVGVMRPAFGTPIKVLATSPPLQVWTPKEW
jgi:hypothetical protein